MAAGAGIAAAASRVLRIALYGVSNLDPASYAAAILGVDGQPRPCGAFATRTRS
jgi:hypothetical protein